MQKKRVFYIVLFPLVIILASAFFAAAGSCSLVWSDYIGVNLIADRGFNSWNADREEAYYMNFEHPEEASALVIDGLPAGTTEDAVYRLEIPNLMPNGDFEASNTTTDADTGTAGIQPQNWSENGGAIDPATSYYYEIFDSDGSPEKASSSLAMYGNTFYFTTTKEEQIPYDLSTIADGFIADATYAVRFDLSSTYATNYEYNDGVSDSYNATPWIFEKSETYDIRTFPPPLLDPQFTAAAGGGYFSIGLLDDSTAESLQSGYIDNIRIVRSDIRSCAYILVPTEGEGSTSPKLLDGTYSFSVYVRKDPTNTTGTDPVNNRMPVTAVSICAGYRVGENGETIPFSSPAVFTAADYEDGWAAWTNVTTYVDLKLSQIYGDGTAYLELMITPTDTSAAGAARDAGSVLIAAPRLEFLPGGAPE